MGKTQGPITAALAEEEIPEAIERAYRLASHSKVPKAEILAGMTPEWLVVSVVTGRERSTAAHMVGRRFAIYLPEMEVKEGKIERIVPMFPGHLFSLVWGADQHWERVKAIPDVLGIIGFLPDSEICRLQAWENEHRPLKGIRQKVRRKGYRREKQDEIIEVTEEIVAVRTWSAFTDGLETLDSDGRNQLLHRALSPP